MENIRVSKTHNGPHWTLRLTIATKFMMRKTRWIQIWLGGGETKETSHADSRFLPEPVQFFEEDIINDLTVLIDSKKTKNYVKDMEFLE